MLIIVIIPGLSTLSSLYSDKATGIWIFDVLLSIVVDKMVRFTASAFLDG